MQEKYAGREKWKSFGFSLFVIDWLRKVLKIQQLEKSWRAHLSPKFCFKCSKKLHNRSASQDRTEVPPEVLERAHPVVRTDSEFEELALGHGVVRWCCRYYCRLTYNSTITSICPMPTNDNKATFRRRNICNVYTHMQNSPFKNAHQVKLCQTLEVVVHTIWKGLVQQF